MSATEPWTIERIRDALHDPDLAQRFIAEINRTPAHELLSVFAKWERIAKDTLDAIQQGRQLAQHDARGEALPGEWIDVTERIQDEAAAARNRNVA